MEGCGLYITGALTQSDATLQVSSSRIRRRRHYTHRVELAEFPTVAIVRIFLQ
jgi:hypothetical protein